MESLGMDVTECNIDETSWYYKGEGNANVVIALRNEHKVLRIRKVDKNESRDPEDRRDLDSILYYEKIILPLFTRKYFKLPQLGKINQEHVNILNGKLRNVRPESRQNKIITPGYVTVFEDLTLLPKNLVKLNETSNNDVGKGEQTKSLISESNPVFCIEIKPKQGWLAPSDRKYRKCPFCLNQYLKLYENSVSSLSDYCPLDLFSGDKTRMLKAIKSLLRTPQNNVRIFQNGNLKFGDTCSTSVDEVLKTFHNSSVGGIQQSESQKEDNFCTLILNMLTRNIIGDQNDSFPCNLSSEQNYMGLEDHQQTLTITTISSRIPTDSIRKLNGLLDLKTTPCNFSSQILSLNSIVDKILKIQTLDTYGADYVFEYYKQLREDLGDEIDTKYGSSKLIKEFPRVLDPVECYLLSTMAKDCSILISFQKVCKITNLDDLVPIAEDMFGNKYVFQINVADVDAKPIHCIDKHYKRDSKIVQAALNLLDKN